MIRYYQLFTETNQNYNGYTMFSDFVSAQYVSYIDDLL